MEYFSAIRKNKSLIRATTRINLKNSKLSERSQMQKNYTSYDPVYAKCPGKANLQGQKADE